MASRWLLAVLVMVVCQGAMAQTGEFGTCLDRADGLAAMHNTARMVCMDAELKIQDSALNKSFKNALAKMSAEQRASAVSAQRSWIKLREADCSMAAGLNIPLAPKFCIIGMTQGRADYWNSVIDNMN